tara:strand:- start:761 stop:1282 length:522 start_codon:yes stop_codon:yes gene_type:complete
MSTDDQKQQVLKDATGATSILSEQGSSTATFDVVYAQYKAAQLNFCEKSKEKAELRTLCNSKIKAKKDNVKFNEKKLDIKGKDNKVLATIQFNEGGGELTIGDFIAFALSLRDCNSLGKGEEAPAPAPGAESENDEEMEGGRRRRKRSKTRRRSNKKGKRRLKKKNSHRRRRR